MEKFIPLSVPNLKGNELKYVTEAITSEWVSTGGSMINRFEEDMATYLGADAAVACQSGTAGLHLSLLTAGVGPEDEVLVPTLTFIAAVNPVTYVGAKPVFLDCDDSLCLDPDKLEAFCRNECMLEHGVLINKQTHRPIKALVVVHVFGNMADMERIMLVAETYGLIVIEDATEALGTYYTAGKYNGKFAGTIGHFGVYSFNGNKIITTGGGGMLVARNKQQLQYAKYLSTQAKDDEIQFIHHEIGYNYRMTNLQAALGVAQLEQLEDFIAVKHENYEVYKQEISDVNGVSLLPFRSGIRPNYWFYSLFIENTQHSKLTRTELLERFSKNNIQTRPIWGLIHQQQPYKCFQQYNIEEAEYYYERILNIPCSSNLKTEEVQRVVACLKNA
ncbi:LegC family aminotransferase [Paenibacillus sp. NFR01]|uniref:LegC family aminotransferase n=1 Tax=Paenibacillus sp. NFR01 TaxID=1566279 RepID=UPI0008C47D46|nr:LegC family aminotransferase [Paenibacillus sp. NFR01]SEU14247.1 aminotransferase, LLPSF_NHT_00031 family [Paenibacillus sp. NFR01]